MGSWLPGGGRSAGRRPIALGVGSSLCTGQKDPSWAWHSQAASLPGNSQKNLVGVGGGWGEGHVDSPGSPHVLSPSLSILRAPGPRSGQSPHPQNQVQSAALSRAAEPTHVLQGGFRSCLSQPRFPSAIQPDHVRCKGLCLALLHAWGTLRCVWAGARQALLGARPSVGRMDTPLTPEPPWD